MNFFRSRLSSVRRPDGYAIRRKKRFDLLSRGILKFPYPIDMLATAWLLGITYPQSRNKAVNTLIYSKIQNYIAKIYRFSKFIYIFALIINKENYENYFA